MADEDEKLVEDVKKRKTNFLQEIPRKYLLYFFGYTAFVIMYFKKNQFLLIAVGFGLLYALSRSKGVETTKITESEAVAVVKRKFKEKQDRGDLSQHAKWRVSLVADKKFISGDAKYIYLGAVVYHPFGPTEFYQAKVFDDGDCYFQRSPFEVTGREHPPVHIPEFIKRTMREKPGKILKGLFQ